MHLGRKYSCAKWDIDSQNNVRSGFVATAIPADAISTDLRTQNNTLSFWRCEKLDEEGISNVVLALISNFERLDKIDVVFPERSGFESDEQKLVQSKGDTPVASLRDLHVDIVHLDYESLGLVAKRIQKAIESKQVERISKKRVRELLIKAIQDDLVQLDKLKTSLRCKIEQEMIKRTQQVQ